MTLLSYKSYLETEEVFGMPLTMTILFAPIFEELIFRGWILGELRKRHSAMKALVYSSVLFGLWHLKNIFYFDLEDLAYQMIYAAVIVGPMLAWLTLKTKTLWPGVILHYINNIGSLVFMMAIVDWRTLF